MIAIIAGIQSSNRGLGYEQDLLHRIPQDLKRFKDTTMGHPVIMGRKTWESLPQVVRPLPGRTNIVITRDTNYDAPGAQIYTSLQDAIAKAQQSDTNIFIIGGAQVYTEAIAYADTLYLTIVESDLPSDAFFPEFETMFSESESEGPFVTSDNVKYWFKTFVNK